MKRIHPVVLVLLISFWLPAMLILMSIAGCETGTSGLPSPIAQQPYSVITNVVTLESKAASSTLPAPWSTAAEAGAAAVLSLLAAWQGITYSKLQTLAQNNPGTDNKATP